MSNPFEAAIDILRCDLADQRACIHDHSDTIPQLEGAIRVLEAAGKVVADADKWGYDNIPGYAQQAILRAALPDKEPK